MICRNKILILCFLLNTGCSVFTHNKTAFEHGLDNIKDGKLQYAESNFRLVLDNEPDNFRARHNLAVIYQDTGRPKLAEKEYLHILSKNKSDLYSLVNLAFLYREDGDTEAAVKNLERAVELNPKNVVAMTSLGTIYMDEGRFVEALELFDKAQKNEPEQPVSYFLKGKLFWKRGESKKALELLYTSLEKDSSFIPALVTAAEVLEEKAEYYEAILKYQRLKSLEPNNPKWSFALGRTFGRMGMYEDAIYNLVESKKQAKVYKGDREKVSEAEIATAINKIYHKVSPVHHMYAVAPIEE